jgi:hypothetical protein
MPEDFDAEPEMRLDAHFRRKYRMIIIRSWIGAFAAFIGAGFISMT